MAKSKLPKSPAAPWLREVCLRRALSLGAGVALFANAASAQELIYQEDFESDGEAANPPRYTTVGRDVYEVDRIRNELNN